MNSYAQLGGFILGGPAGVLAGPDDVASSSGPTVFATPDPNLATWALHASTPDPSQATWALDAASPDPNLATWALHSNTPDPNQALWAFHGN